MKPKRSQAKRASRRRYADRLWSQLINRRDVVCQMRNAGCDGRLEAAHIIGKQLGGARYATRWDPDNGVLLCAAHHRAFDGVFDKYAYALKRLGAGRWNSLQAKAQERWDRDYDRVIAELRAHLSRLDASEAG